VHNSAGYHAESLAAFMDKLRIEFNIINILNDKNLRKDQNDTAAKSRGLSFLRQEFLIFRISPYGTASALARLFIGNVLCGLVVLNPIGK